VLYTLVCGRSAHPYLSFAELSADRVHSFQEDLDLAVRVMEAPRVTWPEGVKEHLSPQFVTLVEALLSRHSDRAGIKEVSRQGDVAKDMGRLCHLLLFKWVPVGGWRDQQLRC
jgi:hypothetical protein